MRSRYTAFARGDVDHLLRTWHATTRPPVLELDADLRWTGLEVLATSGGGLLEARGTVQFVARAVRRGRPEELHEHSLFLREQGQWRYVAAVP
ncbi:MAG: hypothetical protein JWN17_2617 [Frankiales bacterium]|nr:hypothetical protein [Frankiales bacterium]